MDEVCRHLNLLERDYFGLVFVDCTGLQCWLEMEKPILRQIANTRADAKFYLILKFYIPNPVDLEEEYTRYLFTLQIRRDLSSGELVCSEATSALLAAYIVQSDCGDFSEDDYPDARYLTHSKFVPSQNYDFQELVRNNHRRLIGMSPGESDLALLEVARRCEFYGIKLHPAKDVEGADASLAAFHGGIKVYHQQHCVSTFSWAKVRKLSFKRKKLLVKLHPDASQFYKETIEFFFETRNECKTFWKKCVEQHAFFRCATSDQPRKDTKLFSSGSSFRYRPLRSATVHQSNYCSSYVSGYVSDPGTARSLPALREPSGTLDARISRKNRSVRTVSVADRCATSDVEAGPSNYGNHSHHRSNGGGGGGKAVAVDVTLLPTDENMSLSLPNVLDDLEGMMMHDETIEQSQPKSASGESFLRTNRGRSIEEDNVSHDSYRLSDHERSRREESRDEERRPQLTTFGDGGYAVLERRDDRRPKEFPYRTPAPLALAETEPRSIDTPTRATVFTTPSGTAVLRPRVIPVQAAPAYDTVARSEDYPPAIAPLTSYKSLTSPAPIAITARTTVTSTPSTTVTSRPLAGKVITVDNIVITPEGVRERPRVKPVPPPKPKVDPSGAKAEPSGAQIVDADGVVVGKQRPTLISVRSEETPDVEKCHLFNSSIPYTLTLRKMDGDYATSSLDRRVGDCPARRKSVDIVPRKRLPSPASFSSQDHSIAVSSPDQGDLFEYVLRRRSMSQERSALRGRRGDPRRQTQPVRFDLPPSPSGTAPAPIGTASASAGSAPFLMGSEDNDEQLVSEARSLHDGMDRLEAVSSTASEVDKSECLSPDDELPPPPPSMLPSTIACSSLIKKTPPPPPPKPIGGPNVVSIRTMLMEREVTIQRGEQRKSQELKAVPPPTVPIKPVLSAKEEHTVPVKVEAPSTKDSPPFIDDSPKSSKGDSEEPEASTITTRDGLQWTDF
ncbi:frm-3 [Pristionchus pacificus]|nr:frm-3 [Pristionchus pacificus]